MLMQTIASACSTGHGSCAASSVSGGRTLSSLASRTQPLMEAWHAALGSLGCHSSPGRLAAKWATCWPVPLAISSTRPHFSSSRRSTTRIGPLFRSAAGENGRSSFAADSLHGLSYRVAWLGVQGDELAAGSRLAARGLPLMEYFPAFRLQMLLNWVFRKWFWPLSKGDDSRASASGGDHGNQRCEYRTFKWIGGAGEEHPAAPGPGVGADRQRACRHQPDLSQLRAAAGRHSRGCGTDRLSGVRPLRLRVHLPSVLRLRPWFGHCAIRAVSAGRAGARADYRRAGPDLQRHPQPPASLEGGGLFGHGGVGCGHFRPYSRHCRAVDPRPLQPLSALPWPAAPDESPAGEGAAL